jgi:hypothetical protein
VTADSAGSSTIVPTILTANLPQLGFSIVYLLYTGLLTRLLAAVEWRSYSTKRKSLRVSGRPRGAQKSTRMLGLPAKYAVILMAWAAASHWLISQSLYLVRIDGIDSNGVIDEEDLLARLGYSAFGALMVLVMTIVALGIAIWMGWYRWVDDAMPGDGTNSAVISAACHLGHSDGGNSGLSPVMWGEVDGVGPESDEVGHCSFSAGAVTRPVEGRLYK